MQQKDDVHQGDNNGLLKEGMLEGIHREADQPGTVVEWHHSHAGGARLRWSVSLTRSMTSMVLTP